MKLKVHAKKQNVKKIFPTIEIEILMGFAIGLPDFHIFLLLWNFPKGFVKNSYLVFKFEFRLSFIYIFLEKHLFFLKIEFYVISDNVYYLFHNDLPQQLYNVHLSHERVDCTRMMSNDVRLVLSACDAITTEVTRLKLLLLVQLLFLQTLFSLSLHS